MNTKICLLFCFLIGSTVAFAQNPPSSEDSYEKEYQKRIKKERLYGVYIPKDLADSFIELNRLIDRKSKAKFKNRSENEVARKLHFSLGRWIIHNWGFYGGSRFSTYLNKIGLNHPDDMARFIIVSYHRNLNRQKLEVKEQVEAFQAQRAAEEAERKKKAKVIHEEKRKRTKQ
ncbi:MAG: DUF6794 domain-containing protein [Saprospiraceae bacterium]